MNTTNISQKGNKASFTIEGVSHHYANTLRRMMIDLVPTLAIENVEFRKNTSAHYDEIIAHRLGLVPLTTDLSTYEYKENRVDGDPTTEVILTLEAKGPCTVYSGDLKSKDPKVKPAYPKMPIVILLDGQEISLQAKAVMGIGKEHVKWCPGLIYYNYEPKLKVNNKSSRLAEFKGKYPQQIFDSKDNIVEKRIEELNLYDAVEGICDEIIHVSYNKNNIIFHIESWGQLSCGEIVQEALKQCDKKLDEVSKLTKELNT